MGECLDEVAPEGGGGKRGELRGAVAVACFGGADDDDEKSNRAFGCCFCCGRWEGKEGDDDEDEPGGGGSWNDAADALALELAVPLIRFRFAVAEVVDPDLFRVIVPKLGENGRLVSSADER